MLTHTSRTAGRLSKKPPNVLFHYQNRQGVGCGFDLTLHNDLNRWGRSTSMWSFNEKATRKSSFMLLSTLDICITTS
jgi:hypothetical protein